MCGQATRDEVYMGPPKVPTPTIVSYALTIIGFELQARLSLV